MTPGRKKVARNQTSTAQRLLGVDLNQALAKKRNHEFLKSRANRSLSSSGIEETRHGATWFAKKRTFFRATEKSLR